MKERTNLRIERDHGVGWIRIDRPERLNAFAGTMREDLASALAVLGADEDIGCIIITGVGRAFSTGGDVRVMAEIIEDEDEARFEQLVRAGAEVVQRIDAMDTPVIAAVNGPAAGAGACLALACDIRLASEAASVGLTFLSVGLHTDWGGSYFLPKLVGYGLAAEAVFTGGMINAERGERLGIFNRVVPVSELETTARGMAGQIAAAPRGTVAAAKRTLRQSLHASLDDILEAEVQAQLDAFRSPHFKEGITAFLEKRTPRFNRRPAGTRTDA